MIIRKFVISTCLSVLLIFSAVPRQSQANMFEGSNLLLTLNQVCIAATCTAVILRWSPVLNMFTLNSSSDLSTAWDLGQQYKSELQVLTESTFLITMGVIQVYYGLYNNQPDAFVQGTLLCAIGTAAILECSLQSVTNAQQ